MKLSIKVCLFIVTMLTASCAHHRSGKFVYVKGKWVFQSSNVGFLNKGLNIGRIDHTPYEFKDTGKFIWPVPSSKRVSSHFGHRKGRHHDGVDIPAVSGTKIVSSSGGKVTYAGKMRGYGNVIVIQHVGGYHTVYAHNRRHYVRKGQRVSQGEVIAQVGSTGRSSGPHVHFEIRRNNKVRNPRHYLERLKRFVAKRR